jgi:hypothetical protein
MTETSPAKAPGVAQASEFKNNARSPDIAERPWLFAAPKPRFTSFRNKTTEGKSEATISADPSRLALSTTITSSASPKLSKHRRNSPRVL